MGKNQVTVCELFGVDKIDRFCRTIVSQPLLLHRRSYANPYVRYLFLLNWVDEASGIAWEMNVCFSVCSVLQMPVCTITFIADGETELILFKYYEHGVLFLDYKNRDDLRGTRVIEFMGKLYSAIYDKPLPFDLTPADAQKIN